MSVASRLAAVAVFAGLATAALPAAAQNVMTYNLQGTNPNGSRYSGTFLVQKVGAASFNVRWMIGNSRIDGVGMMSGNIATAAYILNNKVGLAIYTMNDDGTMEGRWTLQGSDGVGTETLTPR